MQQSAILEELPCPASEVVLDEPERPADAEREEDAGAIAARFVESAVVFSTDWTTGVILDQLKKRNIDLNPAFQRRDAWDVRRKSRFIESLMLNFPVPQIVLAERREQKGKFLVIDGKQRLLSLQQFAGINLMPGKQPLRLAGLEIREDLIDKSFEDLREASELESLENQTIRTVVVRNWQDERVLYQIFYRLNSGSVALSPQELRQALIPGGFLDFAASFSADSKGLQRIWKRNEPDFRMRDVEMFVRHFAFWHNLDGYAGNLRLFLDKACEDLNHVWPVKQAELRRHAEHLERAIEFAYEAFGDHAFQTWTEGAYRNRFNRAVFDIMTHYFALAKNPHVSVTVKRSVEAAFRRLCENDDAFLRSIEVTTKSKTAVDTRFATWQKALAKAKFPVG